MALQLESLGDFVKDTYNDLGEPNFTEIASDYTDLVAWNTMFDKNRVDIDGGPYAQWNILVNWSNAARNTSAVFGVDNPNVMDGMIQAQVPWRATQTDYAIDLFELSQNNSPRQIVNLLKQRRIMALGSLAERMESNFWNAPNVADTTTPYGIPYWVPKCSGSGGFNGTVLSGYPNVANVSAATYPRWASYGGLYAAVSHDDLIRKLRTAARQTDFKQIVQGTPTFNTGNKFGYYTNEAVYEPLEEELEQQNDDLGDDLSPMANQVKFLRGNVTYVPFLNTDTTNPFYGINWGVMKTMVARGWWLKQTNLDKAPNQHTVQVWYIDNRYNWICRDRRRNFVFATATSYPV